MYQGQTTHRIDAKSLFVCFFNRRASLRNMGMGCPEGKKIENTCGLKTSLII